MISGYVYKPVLGVFKWGFDPTQSAGDFWDDFFNVTVKHRSLEFPETTQVRARCKN